MALSAGQKAVALVEGGAVGGVTTVAVGVAAQRTLAIVSRAAPTAGRLVSRAVPVLGGAMIVGGAIVSGVQAYRRGDGAGGVLKHAALGAVGLDDFAQAAEKKDKSEKRETIEEARNRLGKNFGGSPNDLRLAAENDRQAMNRSTSQKDRDYFERRALLAEEKYEQITGMHIGPTQAAVPAEKGLVEGLKEKIFGSAKPKPDDPDRKRAEELRGRMAEEYSHGGNGPKYEKLKKELDEVQGRISTKDEEEAATYRSVGAVIVGGLVGVGLGRMTQQTAARVVATAEKGIETLAGRAATLIKQAPKGVIRGTIAGDKAAAAVTAAKEAASSEAVTAFEAYGIPAFNLVHGAGAYAYSAYDSDNPAAPVLRAEGTAAIVAGAVGLKYGAAARAMRAIVSPTARQNLQAVENRLAREVRGGPAGVAQARGRKMVSVAETGAALAAVRGGRDVAVAKVRGAASVGVAKARGARAVAREVGRGIGTPYKDTWTDSRGRTYQRKDTSMRKPSSRAANDNRSGASRAAK